ncbi:MAG: hypothetical protein LUC34_03705 [Campylobacter sp.]|nr:hypothetical protein [Campylobacter sp.]
MKSIVLKTALVSSLVAGSALAEGLYFGAGAEYDIKSNLTIKDKDNGEKLKLKDDRPNLELKLGYDFGDFRAYGAYGYGFKASKTITNEGASVKFS